MNKKLTIVVVIALVITVMQLEKKEGNLVGYSNPESCVSERTIKYRDWGYLCVTPCVTLNPTIQACLYTCGEPSVTAAVYALEEQSMECWDAYSSSSFFQCRMDCLYGTSTPSYGCSCTNPDDIYTKGTCTNDYGFTVEDQCKWSNEGLGISRKYYCGHGIYSTENTCSDGCSNALGTCIPPDCTDECSSGQTGCNGNDRWSCVMQADGCYDRVVQETCTYGCSGGSCDSAIDYTDFILFKNSYLSGDSLSTFISNANTWVA